MKTLTINEIESKIFIIRSHKIMIDEDLAALYGVETSQLNRAVMRNPSRFPDDLNWSEIKYQYLSKP